MDTIDQRPIDVWIDGVDSKDNISMEKMVLDDIKIMIDIIKDNYCRLKLGSFDSIKIFYNCQRVLTLKNKCKKEIDEKIFKHINISINEYAFEIEHIKLSTNIYYKDYAFIFIAGVLFYKLISLYF
jgi:hypothetical protein